MFSQIEERYRYPLILLRELVSSNFTLCYQGSYLGYLWSLLRPLGLFAVLYAVFVKFLRVGDAVPHFPVYLLSALFVRLRDLGHIWEVVMQGAFYVTPILYLLSIVLVGVVKLLMINPVAQIV